MQLKRRTISFQPDILDLSPLMVSGLWRGLVFFTCPPSHQLRRITENYEEAESLRSGFTPSNKRHAHGSAGAQASEDRLSRQRKVREIRKARDQAETLNNVDQRRKRLDGQDC